MKDSHQKAAEYHNLAAHAHLSAAAHAERGDHQTGHEHSRQALEHSRRAYELAQEAHQKWLREMAKSAHSEKGGSHSSSTADPAEPADRS
jgi:hypothetical protein